MTDTLSDKQALFCREYIVDFNGAQAAIRAGYSPRSAKVTASRLLTDANVAVKLSELAKARMEEADVTVARVIKEFLRIAMADVGEAFDEHGNLLPIKKMPEDVRRAISSIEVDELWAGNGDDREQIGVTRKVKFWDKKGSLDSLGKYLKMFIERVDLTSGGKSLSDLLAGTFPK